jgi:hypothetical protein
MAPKAVELILMRQLASYLAMPIFLVDPDGNLLYYNEPAEYLLGRRYDETGEMPLADCRSRSRSTSAAPPIGRWPSGASTGCRDASP